MRLVLAVGEESHWDALLPLIRWLRGARCDLIALRRGFGFSPPVDFVALARLLDTRTPRLRWRRHVKVRRSDLVVGTVDDLELLMDLRHASGASFAAVARLPLPALVLSGPIPPRLLERTTRDRTTPAGQLLCAGAPEAIPDLVRRTHHLPFLLTGCPELVHAAPPAPTDSFVVVHPGDLELGNQGRRDAPRRHRLMLRRLLGPLAECGARIQVRCALAPEPHQDAAAVALAVSGLEDEGVLAPGSVEVTAGHGWSSLDGARALLALREADVLRSLASGFDRAWWVPLEPGAEGAERSEQSALSDAWSLIGGDQYASWIATKGWDSPSELAIRVAATLGPLSTPGSPVQSAQAILSATAH